MQRFFIKIYKASQQLRLRIEKIYFRLHCSFLFFFNGVKVKSFESLGVPYVHVSLNAKCIIGEQFRMNNGVRFSESGTNGKCRIMVRDTAELIIGNNVGFSDVTISCYAGIVIEDFVKIGVGSEIRDSDVHSLDIRFRRHWKTDRDNKLSLPIHICEGAFIGARSLILKGVTIGKNSIIAAGSVVTKSVPENEIWGGNPARFLKKLPNYSQVVLEKESA